MFRVKYVLTVQVTLGIINFFWAFLYHPKLFAPPSCLDKEVICVKALTFQTQNGILKGQNAPKSEIVIFLHQTLLILRIIECPLKTSLNIDQCQMVGACLGLSRSNSSPKFMPSCLLLTYLETFYFSTFISF